MAATTNPGSPQPIATTPKTATSKTAPAQLATQRVLAPTSKTATLHQGNSKRAVAPASMNSKPTATTGNTGSRTATTKPLATIK